MKVLVVDDDKSLCEAIGLLLEQAGYEICRAYDGVEALRIFQAEAPDLVLLDVMLPGKDGFEVCETLREQGATAPVLMLSAKADAVDRRIGFKVGASDYITKPFDDEELLLRIKAHLARATRLPSDGSAQQDITIGDELVIRPCSYEVCVRGQAVSLTPKEYAIVKLLASHPGTVFTQEEIIAHVWGDEYQSSSISIPSFVRHIRQKIERDSSMPDLLVTVHGFGYKLKK